MPIYEYRCTDCGKTFEALVRGQREVSCPNCGSASLRKLLSAPAMVRNSASRPSGRTCCGRTERCDAPPCSTGGACRRD